MTLSQGFWNRLKELLEKADLRIYDSIETRAETVQKTYSDRSVFFDKLGRYHYDARRHKMRGDYEEALENLLACVRIYTNLGAYFKASGLMLDVGDCFASLGMNEIALYCLRESFKCLAGERDSLSLDLTALHLLLIVGIYILSNDFEKARDFLKTSRESNPEVFRRLQREDCYKFATILLRAFRKMDIEVLMSLEQKLTKRVSDDWPSLMSRFQECVELYEILQSIIERFRKSGKQQDLGQGPSGMRNMSQL
ncbi:MAG: hypothetical protein ACFFBS_01925 [Promethearchaeota archaeon]